MKSVSLLILLLHGFSGNANATSGVHPQVYSSALAYGRSPPEAREAASRINSTLALYYLS